MHSYPDMYGQTGWDMPGFDPDHTFLCFAPGQDEAVYEAVRQLSVAGFLTLPAVVKGGIRAGNPTAVDEYVKDAAAFVLFLGAEAVRDEDVRRRWGLAKAEADRRQMPVLVFRLDATPLPADWPKVPVRSTVAAPGPGAPPKVGELVTRLREALGLAGPPAEPAALPAAPPPGLAPASVAAPLPPPKPAADRPKVAAPLPPAKKKPAPPPKPVPPAERFAFISYSHSHEKEVSRIVGKLQERGVPFWFDRGIRTTDDWMEKIQVKLRAASALLLVVSEKSMASRYVLRETQSAIRRNIEHGFPIVVFRLDDAAFPAQVDFLNTIQAVNHADTANWPQDLDRLASEVLSALQPEVESPPPPPAKPSRPAAQPEGAFARTVAWVRNNTLPAAAIGGLGVFAVLAGVLAGMRKGSDALPPKEPAAAVAVADAADTPFGQPVVVRVLDNDTPADAAKTIAEVGPPGHGRAAVNADNTVTYTPNPGFSGEDGFEYRLAGAAAPGRVRVTVGRPPDPTAFTDGAIEVSSSGVRAIGYTRSQPVGGNRVKFELAEKASARDVLGKAAKEVSDKLDIPANGSEPVPASVARVADTAGRLRAWLTDTRKVPPGRVLVVVSSGVTGRLSKAAADNLAEAIRTATGLDRGQVKLVDELTEAGCVFNRVVPADAPREDSVAVDVGSGNVKAAYIGDPVNAPRAGGEYFRGVLTHVPGTAEVTERGLPNPAAADLSAPAGRQAAAAGYRAFVQKEVTAPLRREAQRAALLQNSKRVYVVGGAVWAFCRVARPDVPVRDRLALLRFAGPAGGSDPDRFRTRLRAEGDGVYAAAGGPADALQKDLDGVRKKFPPLQLIAAGELLAGVADGLSFTALGGGRQIWFVNDAQFDWVTEYLEAEVNRTRPAP